MTTDLQPLERRLLLLAFGSGLWLCLSMPVFAQEAYYWSYAQHPDLSYFDHPPMVAWLIWLGTHLLGDGVAGIRLGTFLCGFGTTWLGVLWLRQLGVEPWVRCGWIVCSHAMPLFLAYRFLTTPDPPLLFFWTLCMYALWRARGGSIGWWLLAGLAAGCALLSKYTAAFLAIAGVILLLGDPVMRKQLRRRGLYLGVLAACVTFLPVILWNVGNHFESFRFQTQGRWKEAELGYRWLLEFLGGQFGGMHPILALFMPVSAWWLVRRALSRDIPSLWLLAFGLPMPLFFLANALFIQVKVNWLLPNFLPLAAGVMLWWRGTGKHEQRPLLTRRLSLIVACTGAVMVVAAPIIRFWPQTGGSSWTGWDRIAARAQHWAEDLDQQDAMPGNVFFFGSNYRDSAQLLRSLKRHRTAHGIGAGSLPLVMSENVFGQGALEFDHWEPPENHRGEDAIYVLPRPRVRGGEVAKLKAHFASVQMVEHVQVDFLGYCVADADIYQARGYLGPDVQR